MIRKIPIIFENVEVEIVQFLIVRNELSSVYTFELTEEEGECQQTE